MVRFLSEAVVLVIHDDLIRLYGGIHGIQDAALHMPLAQFGGQYLHPTVFHMAAAYGFHLCQNHPFFDGNKRIAGMAMLTFLQLNSLEPVVPEMDYYETMMAVATGRMNKEQLATWLQNAVAGTPPEIL